MDKHIEQKVEALLHRKKTILGRATNELDYSFDLGEAANLVRERWLEYVDRVSKIEDDIIKILPILNSVQVDVGQTISKLEEIEYQPMWSDRWPDAASHWSNQLDSLHYMLKWYRDDPEELESRRRMDSVERLASGLASNPEEAEAIKNNDLGKVRPHIRRLLEPITPPAPLGFTGFYEWMKRLRFFCEHWDELAKNWEDDAGLDLCQDVLKTFQCDLDTSLRKAEPALADVIAAVRRKRDKMNRNVSNEWANEFKRKFDNAIPGLRGEITKPVKYSKAELVSKYGYDENGPWPNWKYEMMNGMEIQWHVVDPKGAIGYVFKSENSPMMQVFYELMGGFDSKAARATRLCWMKMLVENSTIGDEWDEEKIRDVRNQFSEADFKAQFGEDVATLFREMLIDAEAIASHSDMSKEIGWKARVWLAIDELMVMNRSYRLTREIVQFYAASYVKGRITKDDFIKQTRRIIKKSKYISNPNDVFWDLKAAEYTKEWTGFTSD